MFGLLKHENKMSILNLILKRTTLNNSTIMSKERLLFHEFFFKFERLMPENDTFVATIYTPITFMPASVLVYKKLDNGTNSLVRRFYIN